MYQINTTDKLFFELVRVALGTRKCLSRFPSAVEWGKLYEIARKQSLVGICFAGVQKIQSFETSGTSVCTETDERTPCNLTKMEYLRWLGMAVMIQHRNEAVTQRCIDLQRVLSKDKIPNCILKGQGIAKLYGEQLCHLRQSGDIDVWCEGGRDQIYKYSMEKLGEISGANYHHIHFPVFEDTEVEMHIYPSFLSSPLRNKRLQDFCKLYAPCECKTEEISTPSLAFNLVFIMLHCYRHLSGHGVGMRQVMDYYFVLREASLQLSPEGKRESVMWIKKLGMERFARALAWVIGYVFDGDPNSPSFRKGLGEGSFVPDEKEGRFLLSEIMQTGNMGHADERVDRSNLNSALGRYIYNFKRDLHVMRICPHEALWEPWFNLVLYMRRKFVWSRKYNLK